MTIEYNVGDKVVITYVNSDMEDLYESMGIREGSTMNISGIKVENGKIYIKLKSSSHYEIWNTDCSFRKVQ